MDWIKWALAILGIGIGTKILHDAEEKAALERANIQEEYERRRNTPVLFCDGFSEEEFKHIVNDACGSIRRIIKTTVDGLIINCNVISSSGISEWEFEIDFNDYGHYTGEYWLYSENHDSDIPRRVIDLIKNQLAGIIVN